MNKEELSESSNSVLDDIAAKAEASSSTVVNPGINIQQEHVDGLDMRIAYLSKAVALSYIDASNAFLRLALQEAGTHIDLTGSLQDEVEVNADAVQHFMEMGRYAIYTAQAILAKENHS